MRHDRLFLFSLIGILAAGPALPQEGAGRIRGRVLREDGRPLSGVSVVLNEIPATDITDASGGFSFNNLPAGSYSLTFVMGENVLTESVEVAAGETSLVERKVEWDVGFVETMTVYSASRRVERIVDAPAAMTIVNEEEIERQASHGQVPKLLEFTPGAEVTQSGIYDFNFNTRGFNSSLNRRVVTLIDGRDPSVPFLGAQEWAAISFPLDDLASLELVRGPSAALYGANAFSGVLNMATKQPRLSPGGNVRFTGGELDTAHLDLRWAEELGSDWYLKVVGGLRQSGDFTVSRNGFAEYSVPCPTGQTGDCLPQEAVPLAREDDNEIFFGGIRFDKHFSAGPVMTLEGGFADIEGPVFQTGIGRVQLVDVQRPWTRFNLSTERWNFLAYYNARNAPRQLALSSGSNLALDSWNLHFEGQGNWSFADERVRLVAGASAELEDIDSFDENLGRQTLMFEPVDSDFQAVYGQLDWSFTEKLKLVLAGRFDESSLHDAQFSPKGSLVVSATPSQTLRFTYNEAFMVANYSEFFLFADAARPVDLSALNAFCAPFGVDCGFGVTRVLALGNEDLAVEQIRTFEIGYSGIVGGKAYLTIEYYNSRSKDFITDLLPQLGTPLGRVNPSFGPWQAPPGLPEPLAAQIRARVPLLSNAPDGSNIIAGASYTNFGEVDSQGVDVGLNYYPLEAWRLSFTYSFFDFDIREELPGLGSLLLPNAPENQLSAGIGYTRDPWEAGFSLRWVDDFRWAVGPFQGDVESYATADLNASYRLAEHWKVGANLANLFDNEHWESFGGDVLGRRALVHVGYEW